MTRTALLAFAAAAFLVGMTTAVLYAVTREYHSCKARCVGYGLVRAPSLDGSCRCEDRR